MTDQMFSFCETITAGATTSWHIRKLTEKGRKLSGGADTLALCGREVSWDLRVDLVEPHLSHACKQCVEKYRNGV
jgi:hypothetical protein